MLRKSSRVGGRCNRGIVSEAGASAGWGAGSTPGSLIGGSGGDEGEGFCGGGTGFCRVDCGFCGLEVDCAKPEFGESFFDSAKSGGRRPEAEAGSSVAESKRTAAIASFARTWPFRGRTRDKRKNPSLFPAPYGGRSKIHYAIATKQQNEVFGVCRRRCRVEFFEMARILRPPGQQVGVGYVDVRFPHLSCLTERSDGVESRLSGEKSTLQKSTQTDLRDGLD